ncbi:extracellular solute-binding protein [Cohnella sp.]|uniref:extracellular solute-binding protein n=1 Tax=Cohnella sp. TaxID=1883426 RepID=UPI00356A8083
MRKGLLLLLVTSMFLSACSQKGKSDPPASSASPSSSTQASPTASEETQSTSAFQLGSEPLEFSFYGNYDWMVTEPWGADPSSGWVKENFKINITAIQSGGAAKQKFNTMVVSDALPDVIMTDRGGDFDKLREAGKLVALDEYVDKYPNLKKFAGDQTLNMLRADDGKLYGFPNWYTSSPNGNSGYLINKKIYKELGSPKLETFADLESYLRLIKEKYPDVIPLETDVKAEGIHIFNTGLEENFAINYISEMAVPRGDQLTSMFTDPTFTATMKFSSKLFRDKLMTQDAFTQKRDQVYEKMKNGRVGVFAGLLAINRDIAEANNLLQQKDPDAGYKAIWPLHSDNVAADKVFPNSYVSQGWNMIGITTKAKNPEAIFAYLDWLTGTEGQSIMTFGPQGRYWDDRDADGAPIPNDKWTSTPQADKDKDKMGTFNWAGNTSFVDGVKAKIEMALPEGKRNWSTEQQVNVTWKTSQNMTVFTNLKPSPNSEEGIAETTVTAIMEEYVAKILFAKSDAGVDALLKEANDSAMAQGYEKLLKFKTDKWQENIKKASGQ